MRRLTKDEWSAFFNQNGWEAFESHIKLGVRESHEDLKELDGVPLYRAQGVAQALDKILAFKDQCLSGVFSDQRPEPTDEEIENAQE